MNSLTLTGINRLDITRESEVTKMMILFAVGIEGVARNVNRAISQSMKCGALSLAVDVGEDGQIHCFRIGQSSKNAADTLQSKQQILFESDACPFLLTTMM